MRSATPRPLHMHVRRQRQAQLIHRYSNRTHVGNYGGHVLTLRFEDPLADAWYGHDWPLLPEIEHLRRQGCVKVGARIFDLGAHQGIVALMFAGDVGPSGHVIAVEADPHNARVASVNVALNRADNVAVVHAAMGDRSGMLPFAPGLNGNVEERTTSGTVSVPSLTIDALAAEYGPPDLVFLDVEGFEGRVLQGASEVLRSNSSFFVEVHVDQLVDTTAADIVATFSEHDLLVARDPDPSGDSYTFVPLDGRLPAQRFYLIATPRQGPS